ncbi:hypothetical protein HHL22_08010 [Hymenobacter sp. RP-2-7]|uniref:STAS/SEC14 domain-containing protein n=1 Tax=Hymenobacter polaris TaxID=2682546 RepID=A0A7Y0ADE7_9BACT|nr:hypothetical protein [Hymenobacter polaris]NML65147.1 hypothetical protein [Hymenobacter polaris]
MSPSTIYFQSAAGLVLEHTLDRYAELRYLPSKRQPGELATLLTQLGRLLLARGWHKFLSDNRQMTPYSADEKQWFTSQWLPGLVPRPNPLTGVVILPEQVVARLSFLEMSMKAGGGSLRYRTFHELDEALAYLVATE